jgi:hypothetical protein
MSCTVFHNKNSHVFDALLCTVMYYSSSVLEAIESKQKRRERERELIMTKMTTITTIS